MPQLFLNTSNFSSCFASQSSQQILGESSPAATHLPFFLGIPSFHRSNPTNQNQPRSFPSIPPPPCSGEQRLDPEPPVRLHLPAGAAPAAPHCSQPPPLPAPVCVQHQRRGAPRALDPAGRCPSASSPRPRRRCLPRLLPSASSPRSLPGLPPLPHARSPPPTPCRCHLLPLQRAEPLPPQPGAPPPLLRPSPAPHGRIRRRLLVGSRPRARDPLLRPFMRRCPCIEPCQKDQRGHPAPARLH